MFSLFYNLALILAALNLLLRNKYRRNLKAKLGLTLPDFTRKEQVIWIHAVSMGETRAIISLYHKLRQSHPDAAIVISSTTETGHQEAKRSMPDADAHFLLPIDFSWTIRRLLNHIRPTTLILCESDFWYHLLKLAKERGVHIHLVNGKVSERSCRRFRLFSSFTRRLFQNFDTLCVQSDTYRDRFLSMGIPSHKLFVTGNLKLDTPIKKIDTAPFRASLNLTDADRVLVLGSTHASEEEQILSILPHIPHLKVLIVPRHPERFDEVRRLIQSKADNRLILIDKMGQLNACYQIADLAIVGGSFAPIGGHNIFEPVSFGVPVLFGPHMHNQPDLLELVLNADAGMQVSLEQIPQTLVQLLQDDSHRLRYVEACRSLTKSVQGATDRTLAHLAISKNLKSYQKKLT